MCVRRKQWNVHFFISIFVEHWLECSHGSAWKFSVTEPKIHLPFAKKKPQLNLKGARHTHTQTHTQDTFEGENIILIHIRVSQLVSASQPAIW